MITLYVQDPSQDTWTALYIHGEREQNLANIVGASLERLSFEVRVAGAEEEPMRLDEYDWEDE